MNARTLVFVASFAFALTTSSTFAHAGGVDPASATAVQREQAQARYQRGRKKFDSNDFDGALTEFTASLEIVASPNARLYVARSLEKLGRLIEAYSEYGRTAIEAKEREHDDNRYAKAADAASAERALLTSKLGFVQIKITHPNDSTKLLVAGSEILRAGWSEPIPVAPGVVAIEVDSPNVAPVKTQLNVEAGKRSQIDLDAAGDTPVPVPVVAPIPETPPPPPSSSTHWPIPAAIAFGLLGAAGFVTFAIEGSASHSSYSDLQKACGLAPCPSKQAEVSSGKTEQTIANVGLVAGIVGAVGAVTFTIVHLTHKSSASSATAAVFLGPNALGLRGSF